MSAQPNKVNVHRVFRCKLHRYDGQVIDYIGPFFGWSPEWHVVLRRAAK